MRMLLLPLPGIRSVMASGLRMTGSPAGPFFTVLPAGALLALLAALPCAS